MRAVRHSTLTEFLIQISANKILPRIQRSTVSLKTSSFRAFSEKILIAVCFETIAWKFFDECRFSFNLIEKQFSWRRFLMELSTSLAWMIRSSDEMFVCSELSLGGINYFRPHQWNPFLSQAGFFNEMTPYCFVWDTKGLTLIWYSFENSVVGSKANRTTTYAMFCTRIIRTCGLKRNRYKWFRFPISIKEPLLVASVSVFTSIPVLKETTS